MTLHQIIGWFAARFENFYSEDITPVEIWWCTLAIFSISQVLFSLFGLPKTPNRIHSQLYVIGTAFRAIFLRCTVERKCFFDTVLCVAFVGRSVAAFAEVNFIWQLSNLCSNRIATSFMKLAVIAAQILSFIGVVHRNYWWFVRENSTWALIIAMFAYFGPLEKVGSKLTAWGAAIYIIMLDVPDWHRRWLEAPPERSYPLITGTMDGFYSSWNCEIVSRDYEVWKGDILWYTLYFILCAWLSMFLVFDEHAHIVKKRGLRVVDLPELCGPCEHNTIRGKKLA